MLAADVAKSLKEAFWALKKRRVRIAPVHTTRASSLGNECERALYYEREANELRTLHPPELQAIFDLGNNLENYVLRELEESGVQVVQRGRDYEDRRYELTGHVDAKLWMTGWEKAIPAEVKGLNPFTASTIETWEDIRDHKSHWVRKYYAQLQIYLFLDGSELGVFVLLDKVSGQINFVPCPLDYAFAEKLLQKAERIKAAVAAKKEPPRHETEDCMRCPFLALCGPSIQFGGPVEFFDDAEVMAMLERRAQLEAAKKEFEALDKAIKKAIPQRPALLVGDFSLTGKEIEKAGFTVAPTKFWQWKIQRIGGKKDAA